MFNPAERSSLSVLEEQLRDVISASYIKDLMQALPFIAAVLNENRQVVFANDALIEMIGSDCIDTFLGKRPGELLACIHSDTLPGGCGSSDNCRVCGAANAILKSKENNEKAVNECRITSVQNGKTISYDLLVSATPIKIKDQPYTLLTIKDISSEKRKRMLERIFFHDILNTSSNLAGVVSLLKATEDINEIRSFIEIASDVTQLLNDEILMQRELWAAENNELVINESEVDSMTIMNMAIHSVKGYSYAIGKQIIIQEKSESFILSTDKVLLVRILVNMIKNALEATAQNTSVTLGCQKKDNECIFWVHNFASIPKNIQLQIFQRSFSTKSPDRGIGTYSMRLLTENYLNGKIWFESMEESGTTFYVSISA